MCFAAPAWVGGPHGERVGRALNKAAAINKCCLFNNCTSNPGLDLGVYFPSQAARRHRSVSNTKNEGSTRGKGRLFLESVCLFPEFFKFELVHFLWKKYLAKSILFWDGFVNKPSTKKDIFLGIFSIKNEPTRT